MAAAVLQPLSQLIEFLNQPGPWFYPFPIFMAFHAARISLVFRARVRGNGVGGQLAWPADLAGFYLFAWGGAVSSHVLLNQTPPQVFSPNPWMAYGSIHILISTFLYLFPSIPVSSQLTELGFWPLMDAATRSGAIAGGVMMVKAHPNPAISNSIFAQILIGALSASGGGLVASTLGVWNPNWSLSTPPVLRPGTGLIPSMDVWSGAIAAAIFGTLTMSHASYAPLSLAMGLHAKPHTTSLGARTIFTVFLTAMYFIRASYMVKAQRAGPRIQKGVLQANKKTQ